jgi:hypothetical protein
MARLTQLSVSLDYHPYGLFDWNEIPPADTWWMTPKLLSVHGTRYEQELDEETLRRLSKYELINFFDLNISGIKDLLIGITQCIFEPAYAEVSDFLHRFLAEENDHMWFFNKFREVYGGKTHPKKSGLLVAKHENPDVERFMLFARVLMFEEIGDYFNITMANDQALPAIVRKINHVHHLDECRHIAGGRQIITHIFNHIKDQLTRDQLDEIANQVVAHGHFLIEQLYNPASYRDAGIPRPYECRRVLLADTARTQAHQAYLEKPINFFKKLGLIRQDSLSATQQTKREMML